MLQKFSPLQKLSMSPFLWKSVGTLLLVVVLVHVPVASCSSVAEQQRPRQKAESSDEFPRRTIRNNLPPIVLLENSRTLSLASIGSSDPTQDSAKKAFLVERKKAHRHFSSYSKKGFLTHRHFSALLHLKI